MILDRTGLDVVAAIVDAAATRTQTAHWARLAGQVRALPDADQIAAGQAAQHQTAAVRQWVDARLARYPASRVAVEIGRLVDHWGPSLESEEA